MAYIQIRKKFSNVFEHITDTGTFMISKFYFKLDGNGSMIVEQGGVKRHTYSLNEITVYDETGSGTPETFASNVDLYNRLLSLGYTGFGTSSGGSTLSLTTLGESGEATLVAGLLNIPRYDLYIDELDEENVKLTGNQNIDDIKTITGALRVPTAIDPNDAISLSQATALVRKRTETLRFCFIATINANTSWLAYDRGTSILYPTTIVPDTYDNVTRVINEARSAGYSVPYNCKIKRIYWQSGTISNPITINVHTWQATSSTSSNNITVGSKTIAASTGGQLYEYTGSEIDLTTTIIAGRRISVLIFNNNLSLGQMRFNCLNVEIEEV